MKVFLIPNPDKKGAVECARRAVSILGEMGVGIAAEPWARQIFSECKGIEFTDISHAMPQCDCCISIGGDGTIIHAAKQILAYDKPLLGVNMGRVGFLAFLEPENLDCLRKLPQGGFRIEERMTLKASRENGEEYIALNDIVISRGASSHMIDVDITCEGKIVDGYRCDGIIAATPTGSTAYSLSAGGPILDSALDSILLTPISPYSLYNRSIIFHPASRLEITPQSREGQMIAMSADGDGEIPLSSGEMITVSQGERPVKLINLTDKRFYEVLADKLQGRMKAEYFEKR